MAQMPRLRPICPLYIQFKRSLAYPENSTAKFIKDRKNLKVNSNPIALYFELRAKKPKHKDYQHNILFDLKTKLDKSGKGKAFYVAPLFLNRSSYLLAVHIEFNFELETLALDVGRSFPPRT